MSINFQATNSASPPGYLPDVGYALGLRTNHLWYGWNVDNTANAFDRGGSDWDRRVATGNKMQPGGQSRSWSILVPNGVYDVQVVAADPADTGSNGTCYNINVENTRVIRDGMPRSSNGFIFGANTHAQVQVTDGWLTISNGANATNNSICWIEIQQLAPTIFGCAAVVDNSSVHKSPREYTSEAQPGVLGYYESHTGKKLGLLGWGDSWRYAGKYNYFTNFCARYMDKLWARGTIPFYSWMPSGDADMALTNIIAGAHDAYLTTWFQQAKAYGKPFFLRFAWEPNGVWSSYTEGHGPNVGCPPGSYTNMWIHVHNICRNVGATNVTWIWCIDRDITNAWHLEPVTRFFPGTNYFDWVGIDAYNKNNTPGSGESITNLFSISYSTLTSLCPGFPIMTETATYPVGLPPQNTKAAWYSNALATIPLLFPNIRACNFWDWNDGSTNIDEPIEGGNNLISYTDSPPIDWPTVHAFSNGIASPYYLGNVFTNQANLIASPKIQPIVLLEPPATLNVSASNGALWVSWSAVSGAAGYTVYRSVSGALPAVCLSTNTTSFTDTSVSNGITYTYFVRARNVAGESLSSVEASGMVSAISPPAPADGAYASTVLADNPVAYYRFDDPPGASTVADASVFHIPASVVYPASPTNPVLGGLGIQARSVNFNGTALSGSTAGHPGTIDVPFRRELAPTNVYGLLTSHGYLRGGPFSIECWTRSFTNRTDSTWEGIVAATGLYSNTPPNWGGWILGKGTTHKWVFYMRNGSVLYSRAAPALGQWYHLAATFDGTNSAFYVNGVLQQTGDETANRDYIPLDYNGVSCPPNIGNSRYSNTPWVGYNGDVDEVAFYTNALSEARVQAHYQRCLASTLLSISRAGNKAVLSWPVGTLQSAVAPTGPYTNLPAATSPYTNQPDSTTYYRAKIQ